ncbi:hypothetical protein L1987_06273 [Smallanthus sonchifolius]|uniref:Uncharacterized protein n=1 Tax=Smallanthus sonchifolius TaxID=185202 RepID=A0ACB9JXN9_9ASTR|nr:hypothetical protein L1987_06273 [Smallanthus sonchifolius]
MVLIPFQFVDNWIGEYMREKGEMDRRFVCWIGEMDRRFVCWIGERDRRFVCLIFMMSAAFHGGWVICSFWNSTSTRWPMALIPFQFVDNWIGEYMREKGEMDWRFVCWIGEMDRRFVCWIGERDRRFVCWIFMMSAAFHGGWVICSFWNSTSTRWPMALIPFQFVDNWIGEYMREKGEMDWRFVCWIGEMDRRFVCWIGERDRRFVCLIFMMSAAFHGGWVICSFWNSTSTRWPMALIPFQFVDNWIGEYMREKGEMDWRFVCWIGEMDRRFVCWIGERDRRFVCWIFMMSAAFHGGWVICSFWNSTSTRWPMALIPFQFVDNWIGEYMREKGEMDWRFVCWIGEMDRRFVCWIGERDRRFVCWIFMMSAAFHGGWVICSFWNSTSTRWPMALIPFQFVDNWIGEYMREKGEMDWRFVCWIGEMDRRFVCWIGERDRRFVCWIFMMSAAFHGGWVICSFWNSTSTRWPMALIPFQFVDNWIGEYMREKGEMDWRFVCWIGEMDRRFVCWIGERDRRFVCWIFMMSAAFHGGWVICSFWNSTSTRWPMSLIPFQFVDNWIGEYMREKGEMDWRFVCWIGEMDRRFVCWIGERDRRFVCLIFMMSAAFHGGWVICSFWNSTSTR